MSQCKKEVGVITSEAIFQSYDCYEWQIKDFTSFKNGECLKSPTFESRCSSEVANWELHLYPYGDNAENGFNLSLFIQSLEDKKILADVKFSLLNNENKKIEKSSLKESEYGPKESWGLDLIDRKTLLKKKDQLLINDTLRIACEIYFIIKPNDSIPNTNNSTESQFSGHSCVPNYRLKTFDNLEKLLESGSFSDVTFILDNTKIPAHKSIVASCSPVFEEMFQNEKEKNIFDIPDIKCEVMKEVLRFIYTSKVNGIEEITVELLVAAEKYSIPGLKFMCEKVFHRMIKIDNVFQYLDLAVRHNVASLKSLLIDFIATNQQRIVDKPEFNKFSDLPGDLQLQIVRSIVAKNSPPSL